MKNEKETRYFFIWLYISILLHLLLGLIMLSMKPTAQTLQEPDPAQPEQSDTQVIFVTQEPDKPEQDYELAHRTQGGDVIIQHNNIALNNDPTLMPDQENITADESEIITDLAEKSPDTDHAENQTSTESDLDQNCLQEDKVDLQEKISETLTTPETPIINALTTFMQESVKKQAESIQESQEPAAKIVSKKYRPENLVQDLTKIKAPEAIAKNSSKKPLTLQQFNQGFSQFMQGNETFSHTGNSTKDDERGLKRASYYRQLSIMYHNANASTPMALTQMANLVTHDSAVEITIERSGKISQYKVIASCGVTEIDNHHIAMIKSIGDFPPIPKYIEAPLPITATLTFGHNKSIKRSFSPFYP